MSVGPPLHLIGLMLQKKGVGTYDCLHSSEDTEVEDPVVMGKGIEGYIIWIHDLKIRIDKVDDNLFHQLRHLEAFRTHYCFFDLDMVAEAYEMDQNLALDIPLY